MENEKPKRLVSIDALRGFDMFWIIGGDAIASEIGKRAQNPTVTAITEQFSEHMEWAGFRFYDMIFPLFLFLIGCSIPFALGRRLEAGESRKALTKKVLIRFATLVIFGLIYNGLLKIPGWDHLRIFGVLQRQAFGYCMAALLFIYTKPRTQVIVFISILVGYWAALMLIPVPGYPSGSMTEWGNPANYIDRLVLQPGQMYEKYGDPEGLLSMIPCICTALLGVFAGRWLRSEEPDRRKVTGLVSAGLLSLAMGVLWSPLFPVIKKIWTSSYVLVAGGFSLLLLALFYWMVDVRGWRKLVFPFVVIGMNAITIYMLNSIVDFWGIAGYFLNGTLTRLPEWKPIGMAIGVVSVQWLLLYFLYRQKVFLRV